jgi:hypothetical protein
MSRPNNLGTCTEPGAQTRVRSLRTRSTIIKFSARSLSLVIRIKVRVFRRWGPAWTGYLLGLHPSTVHRVLTRYGLAKLRWLDPARAGVGNPAHRLRAAR